MQIHGLSNKDLEDEPSYEQIEAKIVSAVADKYVIFYSNGFDLQFLSNRVINAIKNSFSCMTAFATFNGERRLEGGYQWKKLSEATAIVGYRWEGNPHEALADALACRAVWQYMKVKPFG
jgi:DNA polymerase III epsilon subunit-like protein